MSPLIRAVCHAEKVNAVAPANISVKGSKAFSRLVPTVPTVPIVPIVPVIPVVPAVPMKETTNLKPQISTQL